MAEIKKVWVVTDASPEAGLEDILFEATFPKLADYMRGIPRGTWEDENTSVYLNEAEAMKDAKKRLGKQGENVKKTSSDRVLKRYMP
jgi:hypothetical protein